MATVAGAAPVARRQQGPEPCRTQNAHRSSSGEDDLDSAQQPDGYQVRYRLGDRDGTVRMDHDPGRRIPVENGELVLTSLVDRQ